jgi:hypothetical protein
MCKMFPCPKKCDHESLCKLYEGHGGRHETEHGCVFYTEPDTIPREFGCQCQIEAGDSPCSVHGGNE